MNMLQVRIVNVDFCMQHPISGLDPLYSEFRGYTINQVPTIRVFGSTPTGLKTCLHVHGVFPYIYIPYEGQESADAVMYQVATSLDKAINISLGQTSSSTQHVFKISLVSGIPFYGFHAKNHQFLKIYFYKPFIVKKACVLLQAGNILGKVYQPHEAHIPYVLQFMMDYNLYGMSFINIEEFKYRFDQDNLTDISSDTILPPTVQRMSSSKLEIDVRAENILNKVEITSGELALNPGIKALWDDEKQRHRNRGDDSQIDHCLTQNRVDIKPTSTHLAFMSTLGEILAKPITEATNENANVSVYPAETPPDKIILNASSIEPIHSSQSSYSSFLDSTLTPDNLDEAIDHRTLDDQNLLDVLNDLRENIEDDSILSQATKKDDTDDESNEMILNEPLDAVQTPLKFVQRNVDEDCNDFDDSYFNATINIPQLDGCNEAEIYEPNRYSLRSRKCASAGIQNIEETCDVNYPFNQYNFLDGPNDSSSEDEVQIVKPSKKRVKSSATEPIKYSQLNVKYTSPTKNKNSSSKSTREKIKERSSTLIKKDAATSSPSIPQLKHRRKLSFSEIHNLDSTRTEEILICKYTPKKSKTPEIIDKSESNAVSSQEIFSALQLCETEMNLTGEDKICNEQPDDGSPIPIIANPELNERNGTELDKTLTPNDKVISQKSDTSVQFSDDLFSPDIGLSIHSDQESDRIIIDKNPAEKYDAEHLFVPLAGTSKMDQSLQKLSLVSENSSKLTPHHANTIECGKESVYDQLNETCHIESSSSDQLTPYQLQQDRETGISQEIFHKIAEDTHNCSNLDVTRLSLHETRDDILPSENNICVIAPKYNPPSRAMVESSLKEYNIPAVRYQEPFYSNRADVTGNVEVGRNVLKIPSGNVADLPHFKTEFEGMNVLKKKMLQLLDPDGKLTKKQLLDFKLSTCKNVDVVMTPVRVPPTREQVEEWVQKQKTSTIDKNETKRKKRIFIPDSPGKEGEDSCDSLSISPCTPLDGDSTIFRLDEVTESVVASSNENSEKTSYEADIQSPVFKSKRKKNLKSNVIKNLPFSRLTGEETGTSESSVLSSNDTIFKNIRTDKSFNPHQLTGATFDNTNNFLVSGNNLQNAIAAKEYLYVTVVSMEVIVLTRNENKPNPELDTIQAIIYTVFNDVPEDDPRKLLTSGGFIVNSLPQSPTKIRLSIMDGICSKHNIKPVESELELINEFVNLVRDCDPDIFVGYEVETMSWGFLIDRGYVLNVNLISLLSRTPNAPVRKKSSDDVDIVITGRILIDFWRLLRHEIALQSYTFENVVYHILHERVPFYTHKELTHWLTQPTALYRHRVIEHYSFRCKAVLRMMEQLDLIGRTSELAKLFGIQFYEVLSRGSQFRVESMMLRLAKPLNYIPVTPNVQQRAKMRAPESLPLIMEPESKFYTDPVIVLDFQSLYPSMIIAYNYCFSTCLGRVEHLGQAHPFEFGATQLKVPRKYLRHFYKKDRINISPCGVAYVKKSVRLGILPRMLQEILDTRLMVKKSLKENADNKNLEKVLDARQLGLKLIANVTYGYTAANFSGRMPCIEVADSVVSKGRETLQRAITLVEKVTKWDARVVYGDTDSLFVLVKGRSREDAFKIGAEIAEVVTNDNPSPVKLKLEKVFQPCILQTKKRYVGYMYESATQSEPEFLAKGIETIRRDGCPAVSKMLEKCLKILFDTRDVSLVKKYVTRQLGKLLTGRISIQDLTFAKEYRGASNYRPGACVPALELVREWTKKDKRNEPRKKERVPYVIVNGPPRLPLIRLVRSPRDLLDDPSLRPNAIYYITKVIIPPINRCFLLLGADLKQWFNEMPRKQVQYLPTSSPTKSKVKKNTISQYFASLSCALCGVQTQDGMCASCKEKPQQSSILLHEKLRIWEKNHQETTLICQSCCGRSEDISCSSLDCPVYYKRIQTERDLQQSTFVRQLICSLPELEF